jgi:hypothetical protein
VAGSLEPSETAFPEQFGPFANGWSQLFLDLQRKQYSKTSGLSFAAIPRLPPGFGVPKALQVDSEHLSNANRFRGIAGNRVSVAASEVDGGTGGKLL